VAEETLDGESDKRHDALAAKAREHGEVLAASDGHEWAVRTVARLRTDRPGIQDDPSQDRATSDAIRVAPFRGPVARVSVAKGLTISLGKYETCRVTIGIEMPCHPEEAEEVIDEINRRVEARLQREVLDVRGKDVRPGYEERRQAEAAPAPAPA